MKQWHRAALISLVLTVLLGVGLIAWFALRPLPPVTVTVKNESQKGIAQVRLEHERGVETGGNLEPGALVTLHFGVRGETSYTLRVRFADGSELTSRPHYAEAGYRFVDRVTDSDILSEPVGLRPY